MITKITDTNKDSIIRKAVKFIKEDKLVVYPTDTLYGLGANVLSVEAVRKVFEVKKRPLSKPLPIAVCDLKMLEKYVYLNDLAKILIKEFLPGALTIILKKKDVIPGIVTSGLDKVAVRIPANDICLEIIKRANLPITTTSANISGETPPVEAKEVKIKADLIIDAGKLGERVPSTIVDASSEDLKLVREGKIKYSEILAKIY